MIVPLVVKLDEALSDLLAAPLAEYQYEARTVRGQNWGGLKDPDLWPRVQEEGAFFVTADRGFADLRDYPPGSHAGILLLRPDRESLYAYLALLRSVLDRHDLESLRGCTVVATNQRIRIRRQPLQ